MRLELTRVGLLVELANHYTTRGTLRDRKNVCVKYLYLITELLREEDSYLPPGYKSKRERNSATGDRTHYDVAI